MWKPLQTSGSRANSFTVKSMYQIRSVTMPELREQLETDLPQEQLLRINASLVHWQDILDTNAQLKADAVPLKGLLGSALEQAVRDYVTETGADPSAVVVGDVVDALKERGDVVLDQSTPGANPISLEDLVQELNALDQSITGECQWRAPPPAALRLLTASQCKRPSSSCWCETAGTQPVVFIEFRTVPTLNQSFHPRFASLVLPSMPTTTSFNRSQPEV